jgi:hypothetical protein
MRNSMFLTLLIILLTFWIHGGRNRRGIYYALENNIYLCWVTERKIVMSVFLHVNKIPCSIMQGIALSSSGDTNLSWLTLLFELHVVRKFYKILPQCAKETEI